MKEKYYNWQKKREYNKNDKCSYEDWHNLAFNKEDFYYTVHPRGFPVFIPFDAEDEYAETDIYGTDIVNNAFHKARNDATIYLIESIFGNGDSFKLMDVGCGRGYITNEIRQKFQNAEISALDYSVSAIKFAYEEFKGIDFVVGDAYSLPYKKEYFDIIVLNNIYEHVPDPVFLLQQIKKILKKDGFLIISTPSRYHLSNIMRKILGRPILLRAKTHVTEYSVGQVVEQLKYAGFDTVRIYSRRNYKIDSVTHFLLYGIVRPVFHLFLRWTSPLHCLESTCYYVVKINKAIDNGIQG